MPLDHRVDVKDGVYYFERGEYVTFYCEVESKGVVTFDISLDQLRSTVDRMERLAFNLYMRTKRMKETLESLARLIDILAKRTSTTLDDQLVRLINAIASSDRLMQWIESLLNREDGVTISAADVDAEVQVEFNAAGLDWMGILPLIGILLDLIRERRRTLS